MQNNPSAVSVGGPAAGQVVVIGTGGTIAGSAARGEDQLGYRSGALSVQQLLAAVPALARVAIDTEQLATLDSKDMDHATWQALARSCLRQLARPDVAGVVVTHGTDTLEETAYFLHRTVAASKPLVLTAAMRPATALSADGPQNLLDAVTVARHAGARGVLAVLAGRVHAGADLRKVHGWQVDGFSSGDAGPVALVENGRVRSLCPWPDASLHAAAVAAVARVPAADWPQVEIVTSHAGARGALVAALVDAGTAGIVLAGTGNGTLHHALEDAARAALASGVQVWRASRCMLGGVVSAEPGGAASAGTGDAADPLAAAVASAKAPGSAEASVDTDRSADHSAAANAAAADGTTAAANAHRPALPSAGALTPFQARIELMLNLIAARQP